MKFVDQTTLHLNAGNGGMGCIAFLREKFRPKGGPSGGDGGNGGNIIFTVNPQLVTLQDVALRRHYNAENGANGSGNNKHGRNGKDVIIEIPQGTIIKNADTLQIIKDFTEVDEPHVICKGGNGGFGNARFKTQRQTAPKFANDGQIGQEIIVNLELKVLADVGLVGFPNSGKSTFISNISNARPKIADYPFTTLVPNLGIVKYGSYRSFVMADIPGLIEGASDGKGLGNQFLRHIERTKVLIYLIDCSSQNIEKDFYTLYNELKRHNSDLIKRPSLLLLTKIDLIENPENLIIDFKEDLSIIIISSITGKNIKSAVEHIANLVESQL